MRTALLEATRIRAAHIILSLKKDDIETYLFDNKYELKNEAGTVTDCYKLSNGNYIAHCQLKEGDTTLIELNLNVPVEEQAEIICARWRENSQEVYDYIVRKLM